MAQGGDKQRGGFVLGLIVGLLLGLAIALGVALYITKVPIPFINKVPQRTAEQDAEEAARNKNWDPNAPLAGKAAVKAASGVVSPAPGGEPPAPTVQAKPELKPETKADAKPEVKPEVKADGKTEKADKVEKTDKADAKPAAKAASAPPTDPNLYFIQAGAFTKPEDAEQQRARLAIQGFAAKVFEKEQSGRTVYRVRLGPIDARDEAEALQHKLEAAGIEANLVPMKR